MEKDKPAAQALSMTGTPARPLLSPEEIAVRAGQQVPYVHLPERLTLFAEREMRLRQKAGPAALPHSIRDFLLFTAALAHVQHDALQTWPATTLPDAAALDIASSGGQAPLSAAHWPRDPQWRKQSRVMLTQLLSKLEQDAAPTALQATVRTLIESDDQFLEQQADLLLNNVMFGLDMATAPLIAAGLQVYWTHMILTTQQARGADRLAPFGRVQDATRCPCCASPPTASVARVDGNGSGYRYLQCSLCSAQWHMVRVKCTHCESTKGIYYQSLQLVGTTPPTDSLIVGSGTGTNAAPKPAIEAETCDDCHHYLKIVRMDRDLAVEPVADDLATLALDLLVSDAGYQRHGVNLMLLFGDPDGGDAADGAGVGSRMANDGGGGTH
jgi:FdhE protein